jgi:hypothetical protein
MQFAVEQWSTRGAVVAAWLRSIALVRYADKDDVAFR